MPATLITGKERVRLRLRIEARGTDADGREFEHRGTTVEIHREGALVELPTAAGCILPGQMFTVRRQHGEDGCLEARARVLGVVESKEHSRLYNVELMPGDEEFWAIEFPSTTGSVQAVACMLLECCFCRRREVVYVTDRDMLCFNTQRGIARRCESCETPTIWTQTLDEDLPRPSNGSAGFQLIGQPAQTHDRQATPRFRTRRRYSENDILEVAVPYTKGAANIFVPARVIYVQEVPSAGLHRHGAAYLRTGPEEEQCSKN